jgi:multisubunit Na+/H+ antiporter MnhF subunit
MKGTTFTDSLVAVDFMSTNLTAVLVTVISIVLNLKRQSLTKPILEPATTIQ